MTVYLISNFLIAIAKMSLGKALSLVQRHLSVQQSTQRWLHLAGAVLQRASLGVELENQDASLRELEEIYVLEQAFVSGLEELETVNLQLEGLIGPGEKKALRKSLEGVQMKSREVKEELRTHQENLQRCVCVCVCVVCVCCVCVC